MRSLLLFACLVGFLSGAEDAPPSVRPGFSLAFHVHGDEAAEQRVVSLNNQSKPLPLHFSCGLSGTVRSEGPRIGGGQLGLKGTYYDSASHSIMHVGGGVTLTDSQFSFAGFPPGDYFLLLSVEGKNIYSNRIHLPLTGNEADSFQVVIPKYMEISGLVENIPAWAMESPLAGCGPSLVAVDSTGKFKINTPARATEKILLKLRLLNPFTKEWDQPLCRFEFLFPQAEQNNLVHVPEIGLWKACAGRVSFDDAIPASDFAPVLQNISIVAISADGSITYRCNPDVQGRFLLVGIPDGSYSVEVDTFGNPPFTSDPMKISVVDHKAHEVEVILHAIK